MEVRTFGNAENEFTAAKEFAAENGYDHFILFMDEYSCTIDFGFGPDEIPRDAIPKRGRARLYEVYDKTGVFDIEKGEETIKQIRPVNTKIHHKAPAMRA